MPAPIRNRLAKQIIVIDQDDTLTQMAITGRTWIFTWQNLSRACRIISTGSPMQKTGPGLTVTEKLFPTVRSRQ